MAHGVDGIRGAGAFEFNSGEVQAVAVFKGQRNHVQAIDGRSHPVGHLVRRQGGRDQNHLIQPKPPPDLLGRPQMPPMNRVEGSAEKA